MKVQEDTTGLDLPATHFECIEDGTLNDLREYGCDIDNDPVTTIDDIHCPHEEEGEDHPIELVHVSDEPKASPDAKKIEALNGDTWEGLSEFDSHHFDFGHRRFVYSLEEV